MHMAFLSAQISSPRDLLLNKSRQSVRPYYTLKNVPEGRFYVVFLPQKIEDRRKCLEGWMLMAEILRDGCVDTRMHMCAQSLGHLALCKPMDWSPPGVSVHGVLLCTYPKLIQLHSLSRHSLLHGSRILVESLLLSLLLFSMNRLVVNGGLTLQVVSCLI